MVELDRRSSVLIVRRHANKIAMKKAMTAQSLYSSDELLRTIEQLIPLRAFDRE